MSFVKRNCCGWSSFPN